MQKDGISFSGNLYFNMYPALPLTPQSLEKKQWMEKNQAKCFHVNYSLTLACTYTASVTGMRTAINPTIATSQAMKSMIINVEEEADRSFLSNAARTTADTVMSILLTPLYIPLYLMAADSV